MRDFVLWVVNQIDFDLRVVIKLSICHIWLNLYYKLEEAESALVCVCEGNAQTSAHHHSSIHTNRNRSVLDKNKERKLNFIISV